MHAACMCRCRYNIDVHAHNNYIIMHTLHAWFTVVVHYLCTACDALPGGNNGGGNNGGGNNGATPVYTVVTLLSAMFFAGMAMIFN